MELYQFPWESAACCGEPLPENLPLADQMAYMGLRNIYWAFHAGRLTVSMAHFEKNKLRKEYEAMKAKLAFDDKLTAHHVATIKAVEAAQCRYRKERTLEAADSLSAALDGRMMNNGNL